MALSSKFIRSQLKLLKPFLENLSLESLRKGQNKIGELMENKFSKSLKYEYKSFEHFEGAWAIPKDEIKQGVILYLHGGGFISGDLEYAKGFGSVLAKKFGIRTFCAAYRLAPEHPFPAAIEDALCAYNYLLSCGYSNNEIILCGESAGGGLIYSLCLKLKEINRPMPFGLIAISPWTDLTLTNTTLTQNNEKDPSMSLEKLEFFADSYIKKEERENPLASPSLADLSLFPPSLIFAGEDELLLDDAKNLHFNLINHNCSSQLIVAPKMWHAYLLYLLKERDSDFLIIKQFLDQLLPKDRKLRWLRLDNAAKIYPAARTRKTSNVFRLSISLNENIDRHFLQSALDVTVRRFPSIAVRIRRGMFWYLLEEIPRAPIVIKEKSYPLVRMPFDDIRRCAFRVIYYQNRIAVEFFHAITDGNGGLIFLKTLAAEYLKQKHKLEIPFENGVLDRLEQPKEEELEDSFLKHKGPISASRKDTNAYNLKGTFENDFYKTNTTFIYNVKDLLEKSKSYKVSLTTFITSVLISSIIKMQNETIPKRKQKFVKILVPVNLRNLFESISLRNFVFYITPGVDPRMGDFTFEEILKSVHHQMGYEISAKQMQARITTNVNSEQSLILKLMPLFIKNFVMKLIYTIVGERKYCLTFSNLGEVKIPNEMKEKINRFDFVLGVSAKTPYNCSMLSYNENLYINFIRGVKEPSLEYSFHKTMQDLGFTAQVESNYRKEN